MSRYEWPREVMKSPDRQAHRAMRALVQAGGGVTGSLTGDLDDLNDVIQVGAEPERMWMPLGPSILRNGQATGDPVVSGRVRAIRVSPNGQRIYVGTANGGVWYSADAGATWAPVGAWGLAASTERSDMSLTIGALHVEFGDNAGVDTPDRDIVYVGTGEGNPSVGATPGDLYSGIGVLRLDGTITAALAAPGGNPWRREARNLSGDGFFRLARDPAVVPTLAGAATLVAATSGGLYARSGAFVDDANWVRIEFSPLPFASYGSFAYVSDVAWTARGLFVTLVGTGPDDGLYHSPTGLAPGFAFARVTLPGLEMLQRISIAPAAHAPDRVYILSKIPCPTAPGVNTGHAHLWQLDLTFNAVLAVAVTRFPVGLFVSDVQRTGGNLIITENDQSGYDQAIAVRRVGAGDVVTVGGSLEWNRREWDAALFDLTITGTAAAGNLSAGFANANQTTGRVDPSFVGAGIHPDIHVVALNGNDIWVGCDGGVFRRQGGSNRSMNAGLASVQPGYIANHPGLDGPMIAGTQDNGAIQRVGDSVWRLAAKGDGGGCMYHPTKPHQIVAQYTNADWQFLPAMTPLGPAVRHAIGSTTATEDAESGNASFYSQGATLPGDTADRARLFIGTDRIWYSPNWDRPGRRMTWMTLPTMTDPYRASNSTNNITQDRLLESANSDAAHVIEVLNPGDPARRFDGTAIAVLCARTVRVFRYTHPDPTVATGGSWTTLANSIVSTPAGGPAPKAPAVIAVAPTLDHLPRMSDMAWTDIALHDASTPGRESFYVTTTGRLVEQADGSFIPDPQIDTLWWYDGNGVWHRTGLRTAPLDPLTGRGGSPSSAFSVVVDPDDRRVVYVGTRIGVFQGTKIDGGPLPLWRWRPAMEGLPQALVEDMQIHRVDGDLFLRAALVARGVWERDLSVLPISVGRSFIRTTWWDTGRTPLPVDLRDPLNNRRLDLHASPDIVLLPPAARPWDPGLPNEADLTQVRQPTRYAKSVHDAFVMFHHRHTTALAAADANIDLFVQRGAPAGPITGFALTPAWRTAVIETVRGNTPAMPAGLTHLGRSHPGQPVDARNPRAARMPVDLNFAGSNDHVMLIAVVTSPGNGLPATDLDQPDLGAVVRRSAQIAVRKIRRR